MRKIVIFFGGKSSENEISVLTGVFVLNLIDREKYIPVPVYLHTDGSNIDLAKQFLLFYYSDQGAAIVAREASAIIPTQDALENAKANGISDSTIDLYNAYDGNGAVSGSFAATNTVTGVIWNDVLYNDLNTNVFGATTGSTAELLAAWTKRLESASDQYRAQIIK